MTEFTTSSRGDRIGYDHRGSGPAVVFVAGAGPFRAIDPMTTTTAEKLAESGFTTVVYDRLGRGDSPADGVLDLDRELDALRTVIEVAGGSAVLCGHSSGCAISIRAAVAGLPVTGLVLFEAPMSEPADQTRAWAAEIERRIDADDFPGATEHFMKDMPPEWLAEMKATPEWEHIATGVVSQRADAQALAWGQTELEKGERGVLAEISVPVLATYGAETFPEMPVAAGLIATTIPDARQREVPGSGHTWDPGAMSAELAVFVASLG